MFRYFIVALTFLFALVMSGCHKSEPKTAKMIQEEKLRAQIPIIEKQLAEIEEKMKGSSTDFGLQTQLRNERELARSRLLRIKASIGEGSSSTSAPAHH